VNQASTSIDVNAPTLVYNADGKVTITVTNTTAGSTATPTGSVTLTMDGTASYSYTLVGSDSGVHVFDVGVLNAGPHSLHVVYDGGTDFASGTADQTLTVKAAQTQITTSADDVTYNADGTIQVTVSPVQAGVPTPSGNVTLIIDSN